ncbi:MAG: four helix bundle protein [Bacteroidota bacterium]
MGGTDASELGARTKQFALRVIQFVGAFPRTKAADIIGGQLLRTGTSVAANYRSARKARSRRDFISKITIVEEEADESQCWLEMVIDSGINSSESAHDLHREATELTAMFTASGKTAKLNR